MNPCYCFLCGYDVNHQGFQCLVPRNTHITSVKIEDSQTIYGSYMKSQYQHLSDRTGAVVGWILSQNLQKATFGTDKQKENYQ